MIDEEDEVDYCEDCFYDAEEASCEEGCVGSGDADGFEYCWGVVVDCVDSDESQYDDFSLLWMGIGVCVPRSILPQEQRTTKEESPLDMLVSSQDLKWLPESHTTSSHLTLDVLIDCIHLLFDIDIGFRKISDPA